MTDRGTPAAPRRPAIGDGVATLSFDGVRAQQLRAGSGEILFVVPGLEGDPQELVPLVSALRGPQQVFALVPLLEDDAHRPLDTVEGIADVMVRAIREIAPDGPYRIAGYSFGGLIAIELGRRLRAAGDAVDAVFLIEAVYDERYWPRRSLARGLARRGYRHLGRIVRMPPAEAGAELRLRTVRLLRRLQRRGAHQDAPVPLPDDAVTPEAHRAYEAMARYRPGYCDGELILIASSDDRHFGCDTAGLWKPHADRLAVRRVDGDHLTLMRAPGSVATIADIIDHRLALMRNDWPALRPMPGFQRPLILSTMRWFSAARLGNALVEAGFQVSACAPGDHPLNSVTGLGHHGRLHRLAQLRSLRLAIQKAEPDIVLADDELALALLRRLHARVETTDPAMAALIAYSVGNTDDWLALTSRTLLAASARALNLPVPETEVIADASALRQWVDRHQLPVVLKTDGSWGGRGVAIVRDPSRLAKVWRKISNPPTLPRALKRAFFDRDPAAFGAWSRRTHPNVNAQRLVSGRDAIATVACVDGKIQALVCLEVVQAAEPLGPASVVRVIDHAGMVETARQLVSRFRLSGFCGFDFIVTDDGTAHLLEINPRVTPTCHLLVEGVDPSNRLIALFPRNLDPTEDAQPDPPESARLDIPTRAPMLVALAARNAMRSNRPVARTVRRLGQTFGPHSLMRRPDRSAGHDSYLMPRRRP